MECSEVRERMSAHMDGELDETSSAFSRELRVMGRQSDGFGGERSS